MNKAELVRRVAELKAQLDREDREREQFRMHFIRQAEVAKQRDERIAAQKADLRRLRDVAVRARDRADVPGDLRRLAEELLEQCTTVYPPTRQPHMGDGVTNKILTEIDAGRGVSLMVVERSDREKTWGLLAVSNGRKALEVATFDGPFAMATAELLEGGGPHLDALVKVLGETGGEG